jgi:hypothetical protein
MSKKTLAEKIQYSLKINQLQLSAAQRNQLPNYVETNKYGHFEWTNNINTIQRKLQLFKNLKPKEKRLLIRLYDPSYYGGNNKRNNAVIQPVRNWYLGILAKKYKVPVEWLNLNTGLMGSTRGKHVEYAMLRMYDPHIAGWCPRHRTEKTLARRLSRTYSATINRRVQAAKKELEPLRRVSPLRGRILNLAFPYTQRHRSPSVGRTFNV